MPILTLSYREQAVCLRNVRNFTCYPSQDREHMSLPNKRAKTLKTSKIFNSRRESFYLGIVHTFIILKKEKDYPFTYGLQHLSSISSFVAPTKPLKIAKYKSNPAVKSVAVAIYMQGDK